MATGTRRVLGASNWTPDSTESGELTWADIEAKIGRRIPDAVRVEIFNARKLYFEALADYRQAPPQQNVDKLRSRLRTLCNEIHRIALVANDASGGGELDENLALDILGKKATSKDIETAFHGLAWQYGDDIRNKFNSLASKCHEIRLILHAPDGFAPVTPSSQPENMAFKDLYEELAERARSWGFTPSHRSPDFVNLVMWMIDHKIFKQNPDDARNKIRNKIMNTRAGHKKRVSVK